TFSRATVGVSTGLAGPVSLQRRWRKWQLNMRITGVLQAAKPCKHRITPDVTRIVLMMDH
ncbi:MAG: hypothetical protein ACRDCV_11895, partial [Plesiomonas shigelloides]